MKFYISDICVIDIPKDTKDIKNFILDKVKDNVKDYNNQFCYLDYTEKFDYENMIHFKFVNKKFYFKYFIEKKEKNIKCESNKKEILEHDIKITLKRMTDLFNENNIDILHGHDIWLTMIKFEDKIKYYNEIIEILNLSEIVSKYYYTINSNTNFNHRFLDHYLVYSNIDYDNFDENINDLLINLKSVNDVKNNIEKYSINRVIIEDYINYNIKQINQTIFYFIIEQCYFSNKKLKDILKKFEHKDILIDIFYKYISMDIITNICLRDVLFIIINSTDNEYLEKLLYKICLKCIHSSHNILFKNNNLYFSNINHNNYDDCYIDVNYDTIYKLNINNSMHKKIIFKLFKYNIIKYNNNNINIKINDEVTLTYDNDILFENEKLL